MNKNDDLKPFKIGDMMYKPKREPTSKKEELKLSFPFLEKLLEMGEEEVNAFLKRCENTCINLDNMLKKAKDEDDTLYFQSILTAYGHSLYLFNQLLEEKFKRAEEKEEEK